jgi:hypothetical protein
MTMTLPLQQKLIDRSSSSSSSSGTNTATRYNNSSNNNNNKCNIEFIHGLSTIIQFCYPLIIIIVALLSYDLIIVTAVTFGLFLLLKILVLDLILFKMGKIQNWPNNYKVSLLKKKSKSKSNVVVSKIQLIDILKKKDNNIKLYIITHLILIFFLFFSK